MKNDIKKTIITFSALTAFLLVAFAITLSAFFIIKPYANKEVNFDSEELKYYKSLFELRLDEEKNEYHILKYKKGKTATLVIPDTIDNIPVTKLMSDNLSDDFISFSEVDTIVISKNIKYIGVDVKNSESVIYDQPFLQARGLSEIRVDKDNKYFASIDGVLFSKDLKTLIKYPNSKITNLGYMAYNIPESVEVIAKYSFYLNDHIEYIKFGENVLTVEAYAFEGCEYLETVELNNKIEYLGKNSFARCEELSSISLPASLQKVESGCFNKCIALRSITLECNNAILDGAFSGMLVIKNDSTNPDRVVEIVKFYVSESNTEMLEKMSEVSFIKEIGFTSFKENNELLRIYLNEVEGKISEGKVIYDK